MECTKFAYDSLVKFKPRSVNDLAMLSAILRPGATSIRDRFLNRESNKNPDVIIDELFKDNNGWLIFQEDTIAFLQKICGLSGSEADNIRRAIGRKQMDRLNKALPSILEGYCSKSSKERSIAEEEAKEFLEILSDSASYQFGKNHSTGYSMITYLCAYYRYYHPYEFITSYLNLGNDDDIKTGTELARLMNIEIKSPKFRYSKGIYFPKESEKSIYKGIGSIKFLNETVGEELYNLRNNVYNTFLDLLIDITEKTSLNSRQLDILIKTDFFSEFGKSQKLLKIVDLYNLIWSKKQFKKDKLPFSEEIFRKYSNSETEKQFKDVDKIGLLTEIINKMPNRDIPLQTKLQSQREYFGYIDYKNPKLDKRYVLVTDLNTRYTPVIDTISLGSGNSAKCKISKRQFEGIEVGSIIYINSMEKKQKSRKVGEDEKGKPIFEKINEYEWWITRFSLINSMIDNIVEDLEE